MDLAAQLLSGFRWFDDALRARLRDNGSHLTTVESMVFPYLDREGTRPSELARRLGITRQSTQTLLRGMERKGLIELTDDPHDGRAKIATLTDKGRQSVPVARSVFVELEHELRHRIGSDNFEGLRRAMRADWGSPPQT